MNVSAVSGATYSSRGILEAVADALQLDTSALPEVTDPHGRGKGSRSSGQDGEQKGSFPSGDSGQNGRQRKGKHSDSDQNETTQKGKREGAN